MPKLQDGAQVGFSFECFTYHGTLGNFSVAPPKRIVGRRLPRIVGLGNFSVATPKRIVARKYSTCSRATPVHWYLWLGGGRSVCAGFSSRKDITVYRESSFVDLGLWSFKFMRTFSLSSLSGWLRPISF